jgi:hypothetical protein
LFNLHHASARNVIERIFGVLKRCFRILELPPEYDVSIQALISPVLAALHNFIQQFDPDEIHEYDQCLLDFQLDAHPETAGELATGPVTPDERVRANERRDEIVHDIWVQYQHYLESGAAHDE